VRTHAHAHAHTSIWILLKQETVRGSGIRWAICKSAPRSRQITMPVPDHSVFLQAGCPSCYPTNSVKALKAILLLQSKWSKNEGKQEKTTNTCNQKTTIKTVCEGHSLITGVMTVMQPFAKLLWTLATFHSSTKWYLGVSSPMPVSSVNKKYMQG